MRRAGAGGKPGERGAHRGRGAKYEQLGPLSSSRLRPLSPPPGGGRPTVAILVQEFSVYGVRAHGWQVPWRRLPVFLSRLSLGQTLKTRPSTFEQLRELMAWKRDGLLTEAEYERAKGKILGEEPHHAWRACLRLSPSGTWQGKRWPGGGSAKMLDCLPSGSFWSSFW